MEQEFNIFRVLFYGRPSLHHPISEISLLARYIRTYGISAIRQIIFEFPRPPQLPYAYNISLCNTGSHSFKVQFYHYYNSFNQLIVLHKNTQQQDYSKLIHLLYYHPLLNTLLIPYIHPPIWNDTSDLKE